MNIMAKFTVPKRKGKNQVGVPNDEPKNAAP